MGFADWYFKRFVSYDLDLTIPSQNFNLVVVIPVYNEPYLLNLLNDIWNCNMPNTHVAVISVVNESVSSSYEIKQQNQKSIEELKIFKQTHSQENISLHFHHQVFIDRHSGVGYARKIGMDTAIKWFNINNNRNGIIASLDADVEIDSNYLTSIYDFFCDNNDYGAAVLRFEHPLVGETFSKLIYDAILLYELYLRFFRMGLEFTGYPHAIHTIGSCFALKVEEYIRAGGMSKRKGGEDFYFLHKIAAQTNIGNIFDTCVYPSPRISLRVPFGTGPEVGKIIQTGDYEVYNPILFVILQQFFSRFPSFYESDIENANNILKSLDIVIQNFAHKIDFTKILQEAKLNSSNYENFEKRLFTRINAFQIIKFLNFASDYYSKVSVINAAAEMLGCIKINSENLAEELLQQYKDIEYRR
jgi:hypothetical protein